MQEYLTAERLQKIKLKIIELQSKRSNGYGSNLLNHKITEASDPIEENNEILDTTVRDIKNALLDFNDFDNDNTIYTGSYFAEDLDNLETRVDKLIAADESSHGCRGACTGLCTGTCSQQCQGCTGASTVVGCGNGNCAGGCRASCTGLRA